MSKGKGKFILGALAGIAAGILLAPKSGEKTREELKVKLNDLLKKVKEVDVNEVSELIEQKIVELREQIEDLDKETALELARTKATEIKDKANELVNLAVDKGTPILEEKAREVKSKAIRVAKEAIKKLEDEEEEKKTTKKKEK
ncbi:MAG: YtxH domain-containing protein [Clostridia bacterium]|nr:YtxH domain-containing protein [Clostridia bacterium]